MTTAERAEQVVSSHVIYFDEKGQGLVACRKDLVEAIRRAIIEHSNAELERRRSAEREAERWRIRLVAVENHNAELGDLIDRILRGGSDEMVPRCTNPDCPIGCGDECAPFGGQGESPKEEAHAE